MKKKIVGMSLLSIVMCMSLIVGATFALFTSESKVNIAVSSGKVEAVAVLGDVVTYSMGEEQADDTFANGGTAMVSGTTLAMKNVTPGDKAVVSVNISNGSTVAAAYRMKLAAAGDAELVDELLVGFSADNAEYTYYSEFVTDWADLPAGGDMTVYLSVEIPSFVGSEAMGKSCELTFAVEAVQGNGVTDEAGMAKKVYPVTTQGELDEALNAFADGETVVFYGENWGDATVAFEDAKTLNLRGATLGTLTVNAPEGTVNVYNDMNALEVIAVADDSLHIYGNILSVQVKQGRAVVEAGAEVETVTAAPAENKTATVDVKEQAAVECVLVDVSAAGATANVVVAESVTIPSFDAVGDGEIVIENDGEIDITELQIDTAARLKSALQIGGTVDMASDIAIYVAPGLSDSDMLLPLVAIKKDAVLNLNGHTLSYAYDADASYAFTPVMISVNGGTLTVNGEGGCITSEMGNNNAYGINVYGGSVVVNGGEYYGAITAFQVEKGSLTIEDGFFDLAPLPKAQVPQYAKYVINCIDAAYQNGTATISVKGGTFVNFDPSDNPEGAGTSYLAENYKSVAEQKETETWYVVMEKWADLPAWDGTADTSWYDAAETEFVLSDGADLAGFAKLVNEGNNFSKKTVTLGADINLNNINWTPIGMNGKRFAGTFDGKNYTIYNVKAVNDMAYGNGFFGDIVNAVVKNFTIDGARVSHYSFDSASGNVYGNVYGIVSGYAYGNATFENITVKNSVIIGYGKVSPILGMAADASGTTTIKGCSVINTEMYAVYNCAGLIGLAQNNVVIEDCDVSGLTTKLCDDSSKYIQLQNATVAEDTAVNGMYWQYEDKESGVTWFYAAYADYYNDYSFTDEKLSGDQIPEGENWYLADGLCHNKI